MTSLREFDIKNLIGSKISSVNQDLTSFTLTLDNGINFTVSSSSRVNTQSLIAPLFLLKDAKFQSTFN